MPFSNVDSGFDLELELSPLSLQQIISQLFEQGIIEQTYFLDPAATPTEQLTIQIDPGAAREYAPNSNWRQPDLNEEQVGAFQVVCSHKSDFPEVVVVQVRLLIQLVTASLGAPIEASVEAEFHLREDINIQLLHVQGESYRSKYRDWLTTPTSERGEPPKFGWEYFLRLHDVRFTDSRQDLPLLVNIVGSFQAIRQCNALPAGPEQDDCNAELDSRDTNFYFDQLLTTINQQIHTTLDAEMRDLFSGLGRLLADNEDTLQLVQLGRIGLNALPGGALGLYINTRQKTRLGFFLDHGNGVPRNGKSLRPSIADLTNSNQEGLVDIPGFLGLATAPGYLNRLLPDLLLKALVRMSVDDGDISEETARTQILGETLPLIIDKDALGLKLPVNLKIKRIRIRQKDKKFRLEEDAKKETLSALEIKIDINDTAGKKLKLSGNNLLVYLAPYTVYDRDEQTNTLRCFVETNLRVDVVSSFFTLLGPIGILFSGIIALLGKKEMFSDDLSKLTGFPIPAGLYPFQQHWDAFYATALGWLFNVEDIDISGDWYEAQIRLRATTKAQQKLLPFADTELRSALPFDRDGNLTFEQLDIVNTDLLFRVPGISLPTPLNTDLPPLFDDNGNEVFFEQPIGTESKPYFSYSQRPFVQEANDEENGADRVYRIPLSGSPGSLQSRMAYGAIESPKFYFPVCVLRDDSRIQLLGIFSYAELEYFKEIIFDEERSRLIELQATALVELAGKDLETISNEELTVLYAQAERIIEGNFILGGLRDNIISVAKERVAGHPEGLRLQVSPKTMASLIDLGYAVLVGYTTVRQSSGEVYLRNMPNNLLSDNLEELSTCFQLHFPEELISDE